MGLPDGPALYLRKAAEDETARRRLAGGAGVPDEIVGFPGRQVAEKLLKTILLAHGAAVARTQDIRSLLDAVAALGWAPPVADEALAALTPYAVDDRSAVDPSQERLDRLRTLLAHLRAWATAPGEAGRVRGPEGRRQGQRGPPLPEDVWSGGAREGGGRRGGMTRPGPQPAARTSSSSRSTRRS